MAALRSLAKKGDFMFRAREKCARAARGLLLCASIGMLVLALPTTPAQALKPANAGGGLRGDVQRLEDMVSTLQDMINTIHGEQAVQVQKIADLQATLGTDETRIADLERGIAPVGTIISYAATTLPSGWLECDGRAVSRSDYPQLFDRIGTTYGEGDGPSTFNLPDLRGEFLRGWDHGKGTDPGRAFANAQLDQLQMHTHIDSGHTHVDAGHSHPYYHGNFSEPGGGGAEPTRSSAYGNFLNDFVGYANIQPSQANLGGPADFGGGSPVRAGQETRPVNVSILFAIKY
jgi:Phage Tail Collar Domain